MHTIEDRATGMVLHHNSDWSGDVVIQWKVNDVKTSRKVDEARVTELRCAQCAADYANGSPYTHWKGEFRFQDGDQIGWYVPAVPTSDGDTFHGYTSEKPMEAIDWWHARPTYDDPAKEIECLRNCLHSAHANVRYYSGQFMRLYEENSRLTRKR